MALLPLGAFLLCLWEVAAGSLHPECRKSPEMHELQFVEGSVGRTNKLVVFGGKGYGWVHKKKKKKRKHHKKKQKHWRKHVQLFGDTWVFDLETHLWEEVQQPFDVLTAGTPTPRWKPSSSALQNHTAIVLFGGCRTTSVAGVLADLWIFRPGSCCPVSGWWQRVLTDSTPRARRGHVTVSVAGRLVVYGGKGISNATEEDEEWPHAECLTDTWLLEEGAWETLGSHAEAGARPSWRRGADFPGDCRWGGTGTPLEMEGGPRAFLALFGGRNLRKNFKEHSLLGSAYTYHDELWLYDPLADVWDLQKPLGPRPHARDHHGAAMVGGDLYVFGGRVSERRTADAVLDDLWSYSLHMNRWTRHSSLTGVAPSARYMPGVTSTIYQGAPAVAVFGGENLPGSTKKTTLNDVWVFAPSRSTWTMVSDTDCSPITLAATSPLPSSEEVRRLYSPQALSGMLAGVLLVGFSWQLLRTRCRPPAAARTRPSDEPECTLDYKSMG